MRRVERNTPRKLSPLLGLGIFLVPYIFVWFTLREGYSASTRIIVFLWLVFSMIAYLNSLHYQNQHNPTHFNGASVSLTQLKLTA